ncbi:MAG: DUF1549 domain-containing protein, partial [Planctomycetes bacterium]|nr:DUF1549 domain-containing protein [Planctomycetota bacterium]
MAVRSAHFMRAMVAAGVGAALVGAALTKADETQEDAPPSSTEPAAYNQPISFRNDIEPVLMKLGCNTGSCHGNARGQEGFRLSLFGFDPSMDYVNLTREIGARRIDVSQPGNSLMLRKPTAKVAHGGGERLKESDRLYSVLKEWIAEGSPRDPPTLPTLAAIQIDPAESVLKADGATSQIRVTARYSDKSQRDVTHLTLFESLNDASAAVSGEGLVTAKDPGEAFVMARFGIYTEVSQIIVVKDEPFAMPDDIKPLNYIDEAVHAKLAKMHIRPSAVASDEVFLRRVYVDILGVLPTPAEYASFIGDA